MDLDGKRKVFHLINFKDEDMERIVRDINSEKEEEGDGSVSGEKVAHEETKWKFWNE